MLADDGRQYLDRYGKGTQGQGWFSFDHKGVHFIGLVNVVDLKAGGLGNLGPDQLAWLKKDVAGRASSTPIVVFAHIHCGPCIRNGVGVPTMARKRWGISRNSDR